VPAPRTADGQPDPGPGDTVRKPVSALTIVVGLAAVDCTTNPTPFIAQGPWGGPHVSMDVTSDGARLEYDCATGVIEEPLRPDDGGRFRATGTHTPGHGGPIREGEILPALRARYDGHFKGEQMSLRVTLTDSGVDVGTFELRRGSTGLLVRCL
jgi:hypothetical protein